MDWKIIVGLGVLAGLVIAAIQVFQYFNERDAEWVLDEEQSNWRTGVVNEVLRLTAFLFGVESEKLNIASCAPAAETNLIEVQHENYKLNFVYYWRKNKIVVAVENLEEGCAFSRSFKIRNFAAPLVKIGSFIAATTSIYEGE